MNPEQIFNKAAEAISPSLFGDPHTKQGKRSKRQQELTRLDATLVAIKKAKVIK